MENHRERFIRDALSTQDWLWKADELMEVIKILKPQIEERWQRKENFSDSLIAYYFMTVGFTLENLCKGILVKRNFEQYQKEMSSQKKHKFRKI